LNQRWYTRRGRELLLAAFSLLFVLLAAEIGLRTADAIRGYGFNSDVRNPLERDIKPLLPFRTFGFDMYRTIDGVRHISSRHQELYPLEKSADTYRIVVFGGSTTVNRPAFEEAGIHYPLVIQSRLQEELPDKNIEVINVSNAAYCTVHSLIELELDVVEWEPDLVILSHNVNDLTSAYWPEPTYDYSNKYSDPHFSVPDLKKIYTPANVIFEHSQLYWFVKYRIEVLRGHVSSDMRRKSYGDTPPRLVTDIFKRNLGTFIEIARANGARVLLGSQPIHPEEKLFNLPMEVKKYNVRMIYPLHDEFLQHHRIFNEAIKEVADEYGVPFLDNDASLAGDDRYFIDFVHYTPEGVKKLGINFAEFILSADSPGMTREH